MGEQCPGRRTSRSLDSLILRCPACGALVEMFSDEQKTRCRCGELILREAVPSCLRWCPAAERCLGEVIDLREVRRRIESMHGARSADEYVRKIGERARKSARSGAAPKSGKQAGRRRRTGRKP